MEALAQVLFDDVLQLKGFVVKEFSVEPNLFFVQPRFESRFHSSDERSKELVLVIPVFVVDDEVCVHTDDDVRIVRAPFLSFVHNVCFTDANSLEVYFEEVEEVV